MTRFPYVLTWQKEAVLLSAREPSAAEVCEHAATLADWYNDDYNRSMMSASQRVTAQDVIDLFAETQRQGGRWFLLFADGKLVGDGDFRHIDGDRTEFAIMVGARDRQGQGLGTSLSVLLHAFAFQILALSAVYLTIVPKNEPGRRCYEKVGYVRDDGPIARSYAEEEDDIAMVLTRQAFLCLHPHATSEIKMMEVRSSF